MFKVRGKGSSISLNDSKAITYDCKNIFCSFVALINECQKSNCHEVTVAHRNE